MKIKCREEHMIIERILAEMHEVFKEIPYGIDHTMKVLGNAEVIMAGEGIEGEERELISIAAILHDIGAVEALHKYGSIEGVYQEKEGPGVAKYILVKAGYSPGKMDRICYIIGNHHTPSKIDGLDFQILWEADLIENLLGTEVEQDKQKLIEMIDKNFKTDAGRALAYKLLNIQ
jgi:HD superfamily phosphodiesterase